MSSIYSSDLNIFIIAGLDGKIHPSDIPTQMIAGLSFGGWMQKKYGKKRQVAVAKAD